MWPIAARRGAVVPAPWTGLRPRRMMMPPMSPISHWLWLPSSVPGFLPRSAE
jgi:hypothetical protein